MELGKKDFWKGFGTAAALTAAVCILSLNSILWKQKQQAFGHIQKSCCFDFILLPDTSQPFPEIRKLAFRVEPMLPALLFL